MTPDVFFILLRDHPFSTFAKFSEKLTLRKKCPYSEFFWSVFSPNAGKYRPEKLRTQKLFTQCDISNSLMSIRTFAYVRVRNVSFSEGFVCLLNG